jgi:hypothetical protein
MATKNPTFNVPVPVQGLRKDLTDRAVPLDGLVDAKNVIVLDGSLRPRPGHDAITVTKPWRQVESNINNIGLAKKSLGVWAVTTFTHGGSRYYRYSLGGVNWTSIPVALYLQLLLYSESQPIWVAVDGNNLNVNTAPHTWPDSGSWSASGSTCGNYGAGDRIGNSHTMIADDSGYILVLITNTNRLSYSINVGVATPPTWGYVEPNNNKRNSLDFGSGYWVVVGDDGVIIRAAASATLAPGDWSSVGPGTAGLHFYSVNYYANGIFMALAYDGSNTYIYRSIDSGATWGLEATILSQALGWLRCSPNGNWLAMGTSYAVTSKEGSTNTWTSRETNYSGGIRALEHDEKNHWMLVTSAGIFTHLDWDDYPLGVIQYDSNVELDQIVIGTDKTWYKYDLDNDELIDLSDSDVSFTGSYWSQITFKTFERSNITYLLGCNGNDPPMVWDGTTQVFRPMVGAPIAKTMVIAANRVLLGNLLSGGTVSPQAIDVSNRLDFDSGWNTVQTTALGDSEGDIVAAAEISRLESVFYKSDAIYHAVAQADFFGQPAPFQFQPTYVGLVGPCSPRSLVSLPGGNHGYLGHDGGFYVYDGASMPQDAGKHIRKAIEPDFDYDETPRAWCWYDEIRKLIWCWYYSASSGLRKGVVISTDQGWPWQVWPVELASGVEAYAGLQAWLKNPTTIGSLVGSIGDQTNPIGYYRGKSKAELLIGLDVDMWTQKWVDDGSYDDDGSGIEIIAQTGLSDLGRPDVFKTLNEYEMIVNLIAGQTINITAFGSNYGEDSTSVGPLPVTTAISYRRVGVRLTARAFSIKTTGTITRFFAIHGGTAYMVPRGRK